MKPELAPTMYEILKTPATWYGWTLGEQVEFLTRVHDCLNGIRDGAYHPEKAKPAVEKLLAIRKEVNRSYMHPNLITAFLRERVWATMDTDGSPWIRREYWISDYEEPHVSPGSDDIMGVTLLLDDQEDEYEERHPLLRWWDHLRAPMERVVGRARPFKRTSGPAARHPSRLQ